ncbi:MAG: hypothetical protein Q7K39_03120 [Candidatus Magasanikbacteria bacterium]|nr:hypothetical protein [Candidatus Magasanikbacteria bacterium]
MPRHKIQTEPIERVVIKIPRSLAVYLRKTFRHGQRSEFVGGCIRRHMRDQEIKTMESDLGDVRDKHII